MKQDLREYRITIYHDGAQLFRVAAGLDQAAAEIEFLQELTGMSVLKGPIDENVEYFFMLDNKQLDAYSAFMKRSRAL